LAKMETNVAKLVDRKNLFQVVNPPPPSISPLPLQRPAVTHTATQTSNKPKVNDPTAVNIQPQQQQVETNKDNIAQFTIPTPPIEFTSQQRKVITQPFQHENIKPSNRTKIDNIPPPPATVPADPRIYRKEVGKITRQLEPQQTTDQMQPSTSGTPEQPKEVDKPKESTQVNKVQHPTKGGAIDHTLHEKMLYAMTSTNLTETLAGEVYIDLLEDVEGEMYFIRKIPMSKTFVMNYDREDKPLQAMAQKFWRHWLQNHSFNPYEYNWRIVQKEDLQTKRIKYHCKADHKRTRVLTPSLQHSSADGRSGSSRMYSADEVGPSTSDNPPLQSHSHSPVSVNINKTITVSLL